MANHGAVEAPTVLGINFGSSFSSVAIINKEGLADCIANEDGERQIANAVSFSGEEEYVGIPARNQLVRNSANTILGFRRLLGKKYHHVSGWESPHSSAPLVDHEGHLAYKVEARGEDTTISVADITVKFVRTLLTSAEDYLGRKVDAAVLAVPNNFSETESEALSQVAESVGVQVLQFIPAAAAAAVAYGLTSTGAPDLTVLILDIGATSTNATVLAVRSGLLSSLASVHDDKVGGDLVDSRLVEYFAKEFTKKTKVPLHSSNGRAHMKLRLASEVTKRSLSASTSAGCSVESLADGVDFSTTINRTRLDLLANTVYSAIEAVVADAVKEAGLDPVQIDEVFLIGGSGRLPALSSRLGYTFPCPITSGIDPDEVVAKGCALQAKLLIKSSIDPQSQTAALSAPSLVRPIGLVTNGGKFTCLLDSATLLPARRVVEIVTTTQGTGKALISLWEGVHEVQVRNPERPPANGHTKSQGDSADDEDEEEEEIRTALIKPERQLAELSIVPTKRIQLSLVIDVEAKGTLEVRGSGDEVITVQFGP